MADDYGELIDIAIEQDGGMKLLMQRRTDPFLQCG